MIDLALETMISQQLVGRGIVDGEVLTAFRKVLRKDFAPDYLESKAYADVDIPIGLAQAIEPPYIMARMLQEACLTPDARVLEIGTGSGFQTALLAHLVREVFTIEIAPELAARARKRLVELMDLRNVQFYTGDGVLGWTEAAPFDAILVSAGALEVPDLLLGQLRPGARLVLPLGEVDQRLNIITLNEDESLSTVVLPPEEFISNIALLRGEEEEGETY